MFVLLTSYKQLQLSALVAGVYAVVPRAFVAVFDSRELELVVCGLPSINVDDWQVRINSENRFMRQCTETFTLII